MKKLIAISLLMLTGSMIANGYLLARLDRVEIQMYAMNDEPTLLDQVRSLVGVKVTP